MLNALREKTQGLIGAALLVVLVVPFVLWGVSSYFGGASAVYVARGRGFKISSTAFEGALSRQRAALARAYGKDLNPAVLSSRKFKKAVLNGLIDKTLLLADAHKAGYTVNRTELAQEIRHIPAFRVKGHFQESRYQAILAAQGLTVPQFERRVRDLTLVDQVKAGILASAFVPAAEVKTAARVFGEKRTVSYVVLSAHQFAAHVAVTPAAIQHYYAAHASAFRLPQEVRIAYVVLSPQAIMRRMHAAIGMRALQKAYQEHIRQFTQPAARDVSHIMIALPAHPTPGAIAKAKARLEAIRARILHGASFAAMARRYSEDSATRASGGSLGYVTRAELSKPVGRAAFALPVGQVSQPVVGHSGVHLLEVTKVRAPVVTPFASVKSDLIRMIAKARARKALYHLSERLRNAAFEHPHSLVPAAHRLGLTIHKSGWFGPRGGKGVAAFAKVVKAVFAPKVLAGRRNTHALSVGEDALLVAHVIARRPARTEPLAQVRDVVVRDVRAQLARRRMAHKEQLLVSEIHKGAPLARIAQQMGLVRRAPAPFRASATDLPRPLVQAAFRAKPPHPHGSVGTAALSHGRVAVFVLHTVMMGHAAPGSAAYLKLAKAFTTQAGELDYLSYMKSLRARAHVRIHPGVL